MAYYLNGDRGETRDFLSMSTIKHVLSTVQPQRSYYYWVHRNARGSLPVYTDVRNAGTRHLIQIRNVEGRVDVSTLAISHSQSSPPTPGPRSGPQAVLVPSGLTPRPASLRQGQTSVTHHSLGRPLQAGRFGVAHSQRLLTTLHPRLEVGTHPYRCRCPCSDLVIN